MTDYEKLVYLLNETFAEQYEKRGLLTAHHTAQYLISNGVIAPPCKVGDITYIFDYEVNNHLEAKFRGIAPSTVEAIVVEDEGVWIENEHAKYHITALGDIIFLTKEEALKALKEKQG